MNTKRSLRGFALLLTLIVLAFATVIVLAFLLSARQERSGSSAYIEGSAVRELASQAVNIVIGQINAATHEGTMATPVSWASQPGMLRTYSTSGSLSKAYKLYSWDTMVENGAAFNPSATSELPPATWTSEPSLYTDINAPVNGASGVYPIVDPNVLDTATKTTTFAHASNNSVGVPWDFAGEAGLVTTAGGYYPSTSNTAPMPVQWLYILRDGSWNTATNPSGNTVTVANATAANPIVGRIAFWTDDETSKVNVNTAGEGAYWDTPKAGTADELQFAVNPPLQNEYNRLAGHPATTSLSAVLPEIIGNTVSGTSAAFSRWSGSGPNSSYLTALESIFGYGGLGAATSHGLNPRLSFGSSTTLAGSQGGTYPINSYLATYEPQQNTYFPGGYVTPSSYQPPINSDRLYATIDDAFFQPVFPGSGTTRSSGLAFSNASITPKMLSQRSFFLTANSTAPETTLFDTPRVSLWPITWPYAKSSYIVSGGRTTGSSSTTQTTSAATITPSPANLATNPYMTYQEKLLAFCSTANATSSTPSSVFPYYFQRQNPDSPTYDWTNITRNQNLVSYLDSELGDPLASAPYPAPPGIGAKLATKWEADQSGTTGWITLNCFDYVRSMINQYTLDAVNTGKLLYSYTGVSFGSSYSEPNSFTSTPLNVTLNGKQCATQGTYPSLREAACVFYATQRNVPTLKPAFLGSPVTATKLSDVVNPANWNNLMTWDSSSKTGNTQTTNMKMVMLLNFSEMNPGIATTAASSNLTSAGANYSVYHPVFWVKVSYPNGGSAFKVNNTSINFPLPGGNVVQINPINTSPLATSPNWESSLYATATTAKQFNDASSAGQANVWSLVSDEIPINSPQGAENFTFAGSKIQFDIYAIDPSGDITKDPTGSPSNLVYSTQMDFSQWNNTNSFNRNNGNFPVPVAPYWNTRQGTMMVSTSGTSTPTAVTDLQEASPGTLTVSGGVLMPFYQTAGTTVGVSGNKNWQAEIVTRTALLTNLRTNSTPQANFPWGQSRTFAAVSNLMAPDGDNYFQPFMYVYQDGTWDANRLSANTTVTGANYSATIFEDRVRALILNALSGSTAKAELIDNNNSYGFTTKSKDSASANANLFSNSASNYSDAMQAYGLVTPYDTVISMVAEPRAAKNPAAGDPRLIGRGIGNGVAGAGKMTYAALSSEQICGSIPTTDASNLPADPFPLAAVYFDPRSGLSTYQAQFHELDSTGPVPSTTGIKPQWQFVGPTQTLTTGSPMDVKGGITLTSFYPNTSTNGLPFPSNGLLMGYNDPSAGLGLDANALMSIQSNMDWTRQPGSFPDGGFVLRPDQEYQSVVPKTAGAPIALNVPFFNDTASLLEGFGTANTATGFFSPTRQVPSPVILGTLPDSEVTGWQTLNFCPNAAATISTPATPHPGQGVAASPSATTAAYTTAPDHLLLDLFWMPVAEPYPISEEFATAGKVNLNYAMMPFPYIQRKAALDAVLKSVWISAMPDPTITPTIAGNTNTYPPFPQNYKSYGMLYQLNREDLTHTRYPINVDATLRAFDYKFQQGDIFRSASQICDMFLYPNDPNTPNTLWGGDTFTAAISGVDVAPSTANITAWWKKNSFTADNEREAPYNAIYSRVTTKSNSYTVHWKVQTLKKTPGDPTKWTEGTDRVASELRGSTLVERYIDPTTPLPDYATYTAARAGDTIQPMSYYYKWRVALESYFRPSP